jgi:hypothetical protein
MKLHLDKIINIKNKNDLSEYEINKPIFYNNYLFHYLIILDKLDILKLEKFPVYKLNEDDLDAFMLAAKYDNMVILKYLLREYPEYAQNHNAQNQGFINYLQYPEKVISLMKEFPNIDWNYLFKFKNTNDMNFYCFIISILDYEDLKWFLKNISFKKFYILNAILLNEKLTDKNKISLFEDFTDKDINDKDTENNGLLVTLIDLENIELTKYLINRKLDLEYIIKPYTAFITPFYYLYTKTALTNNKNLIAIMNLIWDKIELDLSFVNKEGTDYLGLVLIINNDNFEKINEYILKNSPDISFSRNISFIIKRPFENFHKYLDNRELDFNPEILNDATEKWKSYLLKAKKYKEITDINLEENKYQHSTKFTATDIDLMLYFIYLDEKYKNLYIPKIKNDTSNRMNFPWQINYDDSTNILDIHPDINLLINNAKKDNKYAVVFLGLTLDEQKLKHANVLFYDFKNSTVERFEPYGDSGMNEKIDEYLEEELTWNTGLKYLRPKDFLTKPGYQLISNEGVEQLKSGDFGGFCLGWCIWYIEHRLKNSNLNSKILNQKTIEKMLHLDVTFTEYIRNYSNKLFDLKFKIAKNKININEKNISNLYLSREDENKIIKYVKNHFYENK